jgi:hypothetical protein
MAQRLIASVLLGHYLSAFTALGIPLYLRLHSSHG